jgi:hypothetical protein
VLVGPPGVTVIVDVPVGEGVTEQSLKGDALFLGVGGVLSEKSAALLLVSTQPPFNRTSLVLFAGAVAGPGPSKQLAVVP